MNINKRKNYYTCGGFGHMARNCRNREIVMNRRMKQVKDNNNNLNGNRGLMSPN